MELLTVAEVASRLRVTRAAVYVLVRDGVLPTVRLGRRIRVARNVLAAFVEAGGAPLPCNRVVLECCAMSVCSGSKRPRQARELLLLQRGCP